jgi:hypothetical protein
MQLAHKDKIRRVEERIIAVRTEEMILWDYPASAHQKIISSGFYDGTPSMQWLCSAALRWPLALTIDSGPWAPLGASPKPSDLPLGG